MDLIQQAQKYYQEQAFNQSVELYSKAIEQEPERIELYYERGLVLFHLKNYANALIDFDKACVLDHENPFRYSSRAYVKSYIGDLQGAMDDYRQAIRLDPEDAISYNNLGLIEERIGNQSQAQKYFKKSDQLLGIKTIHSKIPEPISEVTKENAMTLSYFWNTTKEVFTKRTAFSDFIRFAFKKSTH